LYDSYLKQVQNKVVVTKSDKNGAGWGGTHDRSNAKRTSSKDNNIIDGSRVRIISPLALLILL
jgi:hypothetical protein